MHWRISYIQVNVHVYKFNAYNCHAFKFLCSCHGYLKGVGNSSSTDCLSRRFNDCRTGGGVSTGGREGGEGREEG